MSESYSRVWALDDIEIVSRAKGGDGRTVTAYAAVFDRPTEVTDQHGHYVETIDRSAFNRTLANNGARKAMALYNHGLNIHGQPDSLASVPIGKPLEITADSRGLLTVTRYNRSALADSVLESIKNGDITSQSFRGRIYRSDPMRVPRTKPGADLPLVTRHELGLTDYGPTPAPVYQDAEIVAVRSAHQLVEDFMTLDDVQRAELIRLLSATRSDSAGIATVNPTPGTEDSRDAHSIRMAQLRLKAQAAFSGVQSNGT